MGPRRIRRGELSRPTARYTSWRACGFNGATANSPWRTTGASWMMFTTTASFNGATANSPWRTLVVRVRRAAHVRASMGPRRIRRGEQDVGRDPRKTWRELQWGHGEFAVENTDASGKEWIAEGQLQWGHGEFAVENGVSQLCMTVRSGWLQWGHGEFAVENVRPCPGLLKEITRLQWGHGEFAVENDGVQSLRAGEGEVLQWGHGEFAVENDDGDGGRIAPDMASMGPRRIRRGEPLDARMLARPPTMASMGPRRIRRGERRGCARLEVHLVDASMGPRRIRRGERPRADDTRPTRRSASMGPRRIRRGERTIPGAVANGLPALQWGHGEFAVENGGILAHGPQSRHAASMGPRRIRRGEPRRATTSSGRKPSFNGATANSPWRTHARHHAHVPTARASMGPRRIRRGELDDMPGAGWKRTDASMGPRRIRRGELASR